MKTNRSPLPTAISFYARYFELYTDTILGVYSDRNEVARATDGSHQSYLAFKNKADTRADFQSNRPNGGGIVLKLAEVRSGKVFYLVN